VISHGHFDHTAGLITSCPSITSFSEVYGLEDTLDILIQSFDGRSWPSLAKRWNKDWKNMEAMKGAKLILKE
jgi:cAMP phosphodiesterase